MKALIKLRRVVIAVFLSSIFFSELSFADRTGKMEFSLLIPFLDDGNDTRDRFGGSVDSWSMRVGGDYYFSTEDSFTYGIGLGLRFDVIRSHFVRLGYYLDYVDFDNAPDTIDFDSFRFEFGFSY